MMAGDEEKKCVLVRRRGIVKSQALMKMERSPPVSEFASCALMPSPFPSPRSYGLRVHSTQHYIHTHPVRIVCIHELSLIHCCCIVYVHQIMELARS